MTSATRSDALPDIPTVRRVRAGLRGDRLVWRSARPRDTPAEIIDKLNNEINAVLADPTIKARLSALGAEPMPMTSCRLRKVHVRRNREMGQGDQVRRYQAGLMRN